MPEDLTADTDSCKVIHWKPLGVRKDESDTSAANTDTSLTATDVLEMMSDNIF